MRSSRVGDFVTSIPAPLFREADKPLPTAAQFGTLAKQQSCQRCVIRRLTLIGASNDFATLTMTGVQNTQKMS